MGSRKAIRIIRDDGVEGVVVSYKKYKGKKRFKIYYPEYQEKNDYFPYTYVVKEGKHYKCMIDTEKGIDLPEELKEDFRGGHQEYKSSALTPEEERKIKDEQIENFTRLHKEVEGIFDLQKVIELIEKIQIRKYSHDDSVEEEDDVRYMGYYGKKSSFGKCIFFNDLDIANEEHSGKALRFHEFIHYIQDELQKENSPKIMRIMDEAQTESLAQRMFENNQSSVVEYGEDRTNRKTLIHYNFPQDTAYRFPVCILRQMETIMGKRTYESSFVNRKKFSEEFINKYGKELYTFLIIRMTVLEYSADSKKNNVAKNKQFYLSDTQDKLMKEVFRQDFNRMKTIEDATNLLQRLRELETSRANIYIEGNNHDVKSLNKYKEYYTKLYSRIAHKLLERGYSKEDINLALEQYAYKKQEYGPIVLESDIANQLPELAQETVESFKKKKQYDEKEYHIEYFLRHEGSLYIAVMNKEGKIEIVKEFLGKATKFKNEIEGGPNKMPQDVKQAFEQGKGVKYTSNMNSSKKEVKQVEEIDAR